MGKFVENSKDWTGGGATSVDDSYFGVASANIYCGKKSCRNSTNKFSIFKNKDSSKAILGYKSFKLTFLNINDYELNNLLYNEAIELDKRTYCQYYWSLLKLKHLLIFTFYSSHFLYIIQ